LKHGPPPPSGITSPVKALPPEEGIETLATFSLSFSSRGVKALPPEEGIETFFIFLNFSNASW